jgi:hypothetical protein
MFTPIVDQRWRLGLVPSPLATLRLSGSPSAGESRVSIFYFRHDDSTNRKRKTSDSGLVEEKQEPTCLSALFTVLSCFVLFCFVLFRSLFSPGDQSINQPIRQKESRCLDGSPGDVGARAESLVLQPS